MSIVKIEIELPQVMYRKWHDTEFTFTPEHMSDSWRARIFEYGLRVFNDTYGKLGDKPADKIEHIQLAVLACNAGEEYEGRSRGGSTALPDHMALALSNAKDVLKIRFKKIAIQAKAKGGKIADWCAASPAIAAYFIESDGKYTWNDEKVFSWIEDEKARSGVDYIGEAERELAMVNDVDAVDVSDLI